MERSDQGLIGENDVNIRVDLLPSDCAIEDHFGFVETIGPERIAGRSTRWIESACGKLSKRLPWRGS